MREKTVFLALVTVYVCAFILWSFTMFEMY